MMYREYSEAIQNRYIKSTYDKFDHGLLMARYNSIHAHSF